MKQLQFSNLELISIYALLRQYRNMLERMTTKECSNLDYQKQFASHFCLMFSKHIPAEINDLFDSVEKLFNYGLGEDEIESSIGEEEREKIFKFLEEQ